MSFNTTIELADGTEVEVTVEYDASHTAGRFSGPPEDCYPADGEMTLTECLPSSGDYPDCTVAEFIKARDLAEDRLIAFAWEDYHGRGNHDIK